jgi:hypothetical protein
VKDAKLNLCSTIISTFGENYCNRTLNSAEVALIDKAVHSYLRTESTCAARQVKAAKEGAQ